MTVALPDSYIVQPDGSANAEGVQRNFQALAQASVDTGGRAVKLRYGAGSFVFNANNDDDGTAVITHGLGSTPLAVSVLPAGTGTSSIVVGVSNVGATTFQPRARHYDGTNLTATIAFYWIACA